MKQEILDKYSIPVPRYTSYPPANFFNESFLENRNYRDIIIESNGQSPEHISIYIHIPFCYQMCYYCGCNSIQLRSKETVTAYINALTKELKMVLPLLDSSRKISQIHYGGGTPTSQPVAVLKEINEIILSQFKCIDKPEIAIECHPGYLDEKYWNDLVDAGFNRISLGVQDFNPDVLKASNRKPSRIAVKEIVSLLKSKGVSTNMDFIYGLPLQTPETFSETMEKAIEINPDRIVTFSYAHVPWVNELQRKLEETGLPAVGLKSKMYEAARKLLVDAGYKSIGLDHFVCPEDELYKAAQSQSLHRNFQGYCTRSTTGQVYAFGTTGISQLWAAYIQNTKSIEQYIAMVNADQYPTMKGYILTQEEQIRREVISRLMCNYIVCWSEVASDLGISANEVLSSINYNESVLKEYADDGIIDFDKQQIIMRPDATPFVRNVAASLDKLFTDNKGNYSKSI